MQTNIGELKNYLTVAQEESLPYILSRSINDTMKDVVKVEKARMRDVFESPTPWTVNSIYQTYSNKDDIPIESRLEFKEFGAGKGTPAWKYLQFQIEGGARRHKRYEKALILRGLMKSSEYTVPAPGVKLNRYGNISAGQIEKMLSNLGAAEVTAGFTANASDSKRSKSKRRRMGQYFIPPEGSNLTRGVYWRRGKILKPFLLIVPRPPQYKKRLDWFEIAEDTINIRFRVHLEKWLDRVNR